MAEPYAFDERLFAERLASVLNQKLAPLVEDLQSIRQKLGELEARTEVARREMIRSLSEALMQTKVAELAKGYIEPGLREVAGRVDRLEAQLTALVQNLRALADLVRERVEPVAARELEVGEELFREYEPGVQERIDALVERVAALQQQLASDLPSIAARLSRLETTLAALQKALENHAEALRQIQQAQAALQKALEEQRGALAEALGMLGYIHEQVRARVGEEAEEAPRRGERR